MFTYDRKDTALGLMLEDIASKIGDKPFLQFREEKEVTYAEVNEIGNRIGNSLVELGVKKGDNVSIFSPNSLEFLYSIYGISKIGAAEAAVNTAYKGDFLSYILNDSRSEVLVVEGTLLPLVEQVEGKLEYLKKVVIIPSDQKHGEKPKWRFKSYWFEELLGGSPKLPGVAREVTHKMIASITYTSGTTGPSKGVMIPHYYLYVAATTAIEIGDMTSNDVSLVCAPFFHGNPKFLQVYAAMLSGSKAVVYPKFSVSEFWSWVRKHNVTRTNLVGVMMPFLLSQPPREDEGENPLEICLLAPNPAGMTEQFIERFKLKGCSAAFGQSETNLIAVKHWNEEVPPGCPGKINTKYLDVRIFDENDDEAPVGVQGEIVLRPKEPYLISMGFYNKPEKTAEALRNCWFHTGDGGYIDKDGYFYFTDRIKDYIRRRGENVSSVEVEVAISAHPKIKEVAVIGISTEYGGLEQEIMAYIVLQEDAELKPEELMKWCEERLPYYVIPRYIEFIEDMPKTPTERVKKYELKKLGISENTWDREKAGYQIKR